MLSPRPPRFRPDGYVRELTDVRKLVEMEIGRISLTEGDAVWESHVIAALHRAKRFDAMAMEKMSLEMMEWERLNEEFFDALFSACESTLLQKIRMDTYLYAKRYVRVCLSVPMILSLYRNRSEIAEAMIAKDHAAFQSLYTNHLDSIYKEVSRSGLVSLASSS